MATEFSREFFSANRIVKADLRAARQPREDDITRIKAEVKKLYDATEVLLNITVDESLLSGYVLQIGDRVFDNSGRHALDQMMEGKPSLATLKTRVEDYKPAATSAEGGVVIASADGIVQVDGMDRAVYGEIVTFENGAKGMVESVDPGKLGVMLFDGAESVGVGTLVTRSGKRAGIPVGDAFLGRVIDPLGEPIDGKGPIESVGYNPIEKQAPGILERQSVDTPLHTGILAIDSMFPIGRGQRELIIGDRQTGKTSIATDAILNQKDTGVHLHLRRHRPESFFQCAQRGRGSDRSTVPWITPPSWRLHRFRQRRRCSTLPPMPALALAEYFMCTGQETSSSFTMTFPSTQWPTVPSPCCCGAPPAVRLTPAMSSICTPVCWSAPAGCRDDLGGGSITALPIVETQAGDVSAYIPTNVISITDGQIFLESDLFNAGNRPAVNVGLSVSRVGGAAQTKAMKKANSGTSALSWPSTRIWSLSPSSALIWTPRPAASWSTASALMEMLKQPLYQPKSDAEQVVILTLASHGMLDSLPTTEQRAKTTAFVRQFRADVSGTMDAITIHGQDHRRSR